VLPLLFLLFVAVPIIEIAVIVQVGQWLGFWATLGLLIADSIIGAALMRSQGRAVWRRFTLALSEGRPPAREVLDGVLVIFGGALALTPGFVTDLLAIFLLLPPTRAIVRRVLVRSLARRGAMRIATWPASDRARQPYDVDGTAHEVRDDPRRLP
jgi:UPF0716 protein FxsA